MYSSTSITAHRERERPIYLREPTAESLDTLALALDDGRTSDDIAFRFSSIAAPAVATDIEFH